MKTFAGMQAMTIIRVMETGELQQAEDRCFCLCTAASGLWPFPLNRKQSQTSSFSGKLKYSIEMAETDAAAIMI